MNKKETIDGYTFEYDSKHKHYECRGDVCYDDEHDEVPEKGLWIAAEALEQKLKNQGIDAEVEYSEKGWVEVYIN
jgi:porphobilinogen deaminase